MNKIISKELLREVLIDKIKEKDYWFFDILDYSIDNTHILINYKCKDGVKKGFFINIHTLESSIIDWIEAQGYWIRKPSKNDYDLCWGSAEVFRVYTEDRHTVPFICGQAILKNKKDK